MFPRLQLLLYVLRYRRQHPERNYQEIKYDHQAYPAAPDLPFSSLRTRLRAKVSKPNIAVVLGVVASGITIYTFIPTSWWQKMWGQAAGLTPYLSNPVFMYHYVLTPALFVLVAGCVVMLRKCLDHAGELLFYRNLCKAAPHQLRKLEDSVLTQVSRHPLSLLRSNTHELNRILIDLITQLRDLFRSLDVAGSVTVMLLIPGSPEDPNSTRPTHLKLAIWSRPYDGYTTKRFEEVSKKAEAPAFAMDDCCGGRIFYSKSSLLIRDTRNPLPFPQPSHRFSCGVRSLICVPIVLDGHTEFVLTVESTEENQLHLYHIDVARAAAGIVAMTLTFADLQEALRRAVDAPTTSNARLPNTH